MSITEELADALAIKAIAAAETLDDDMLVANVAKVLGATSTTTEEAYLTAVRVRVAEARAQVFIEKALSKGKA